jgi:hypothetical protein
MQRVLNKEVSPIRLSSINNYLVESRGIRQAIIEQFEA